MEPKGVERRLAAILAADVVGYTRLMEADEEGTLARLNALHRDLIDPIVGENRGQIVKLMGDGMLVEFASVVDAVRCAVEIQREIRARESGALPGECMTLRIGVNLGDIIHQDGDIFGNGVNIAVRMQQLAEPGSVTISEDVYHQVDSKLPLNYQDLGRQELKNIGRPIHAYRAIIDPVIDPVAIGADANGTIAVSGARGWAKNSWRWIAAVALTVVLIAGGIVMWIQANQRGAGSPQAECIDHLGLPVLSENCPEN